MEENKDAILEMQQKIIEQEISSQQMIKQKFITGEYKKTIKQVTKTCKLKQRCLKYDDEINFTTENKKEMQQKHKHDQMNDLEWYRVIVEREQLKIDKRIAILNLLNDEHKPSIPVKEAELKIFDTNYYEVHEV